MRVLIWICVAAGLAGGAVYGFNLYMEKPLPEIRSGVVEVKKGKSLEEISRAFFGGSRTGRAGFKAYVILTGRSRRLKAGEYELSNDSIKSLTKKLTGGKTLQYRVTVAEGAWSDHVAALLAGAGLGREERFKQLIRDPAFARKLTGTDAPTLEGFLFPETYFFEKGMPEEEILKVFVARFNEIALPLIRSAPNTPEREILTLASVVEREAAVEDERGLIASVFLNRLKKNMPLESCVTVEYALGIKKKILTDRDLQVDSPYNTYRHAGLPPGPVCNPGRAAIRAVIAPVPSDDLFFVARGDGRHEFSKTFAEHKRAKNKLRLEEKRRRRGLP